MGKAQIMQGQRTGNCRREEDGEAAIGRIRVYRPGHRVLALAALGGSAHFVLPLGARKASLGDAGPNCLIVMLVVANSVPSNDILESCVEKHLFPLSHSCSALRSIPRLENGIRDRLAAWQH